jgi:hypothetical protein
MSDPRSLLLRYPVHPRSPLAHRTVLSRALRVLHHCLTLTTQCIGASFSNIRLASNNYAHENSPFLRKAVEHKMWRCLIRMELQVYHLHPLQYNRRKKSGKLQSLQASRLTTNQKPQLGQTPIWQHLLLGVMYLYPVPWRRGACLHQPIIVLNW